MISPNANISIVLIFCRMSKEVMRRLEGSNCWQKISTVYSLLLRPAVSQSVHKNIRSLIYLSMFLMSILQLNIITRISVSLPTLLSTYNYWRLIWLFPQSQQMHSTNFVHKLTRSYVKVGRIPLLSRASHLIGNFFHGHNLNCCLLVAWAGSD
jgi:hypothetical protein